MIFLILAKEGEKPIYQIMIPQISLTCIKTYINKRMLEKKNVLRYILATNVNDISSKNTFFVCADYKIFLRWKI